MLNMSGYRQVTELRDIFKELNQTTGGKIRLNVGFLLLTTSLNSIG